MKGMVLLALAVSLGAHGNEYHYAKEAEFRRYMEGNPVCEHFKAGKLGEDAHYMIVHSGLCGWTVISPTIKTSPLDAGVIAFFEHTDRTDYCEFPDELDMLDKVWRYDVCQWRDRNINWYE